MTPVETAFAETWDRTISKLLPERLLERLTKSDREEIRDACLIAFIKGSVYGFDRSISVAKGEEATA